MNPQPTDLRSARVVVLRGGASSERDVSLRTGTAILAALRDASDGRGPAQVEDVVIDPRGAWWFRGEGHAPEDVLGRVDRDAIWFLALHGGAGEDGTVQGFLETAGRKHTGSRTGASALCMDKGWTRRVLEAAGLRVAPGLLIEPFEWLAERAECLRQATALSRDGYAVKPNRGGSSVATFLVATEHELEGAIESVLATGDTALVEARVVGSEATCGVLGRERGPWRALTPVEIVPKDGRFFDYEEKYSATGAREFCPPRSISKLACERVQDAALRAFRAARCAGYARVDVMIPRAAVDGGSEPVVLEINTLPGMTDRSLLPLAAAADGISFRELCHTIVGLALDDGARVSA